MNTKPKDKFTVFILETIQNLTINQSIFLPKKDYEFKSLRDLRVAVTKARWQYLKDIEIEVEAVYNGINGVKIKRLK